MVKSESHVLSRAHLCIHPAECRRQLAKLASIWHQLARFLCSWVCGWDRWGIPNPEKDITQKNERKNLGHDFRQEKEIRKGKR
jgi:hypothetical protein